MNQCAINECTRKAVAKGLCQKHYVRMSKYGDPLFLLRSPNGTGSWQKGYWTITLPDGRRVKQSILNAEKALGKNLPSGAEVHHFDGDKANDSNNNLVVCQDHSYHFILHQRSKAFRECGHADWYRCQVCRKYGPPSEVIHDKNQSSYHIECEKQRQREKRQRISNKLRIMEAA